jgi:hypothetical protein
MISQRYNIEGFGEMIYSHGTFVDNVKDLDGRLISPRDEAFALQQIKDEQQIIKGYETRVAIRVDYLKNELPVLSKYRSLNIDLAKKVVNANSQGKYYCTNSYEAYKTRRKIADEEESQGILYAHRRSVVTPRDDFEMSLTQYRYILDFLFQDQAEVFYQFRGGFPIKFYTLDKKIIDFNNPELLNTNGTIIIPYLYFGCRFGSLRSYSYFDAKDRHSDNSNMACRIL